MKVTTVSVIGVLLIGAIVGFVMNQPTPERTISTTVHKPAPNTAKSAAPAKVIPGAYIDYSDDAFNKASGTRLLFFHASWCPQCRKLDTDIRAQAQLPTGLTIFKVDYDTATTLRQKYGVTLQTTIVKVDKNGDLITKVVAYDQPTFATLADNLNIH